MRLYAGGRVVFVRVRVWPIPGEISSYFGICIFSVCLPKREGAKPPASISIHAIRFGIISISCRLLNACNKHDEICTSTRRVFRDASKVAKRMMAGLCDGWGRCGGKYFQRIILLRFATAMLLPLTPPPRRSVVVVIAWQRTVAQFTPAIARFVGAVLLHGCHHATTDYGLYGGTQNKNMYA